MFKRCVIILQVAIALVMVICVGLPAAAAPPAPPLVAVILPRDNARFQTIHAAFLRNFENIKTPAGKPRLYLQSPSTDLMSLRNSLRKAMALGADLIVVYGTRAASAAQLEHLSVPLIFADVFDPLGMGLVPSSGHGSTLMTGVCGQAPLPTLFKALQEVMGTIRLGVPIEARYKPALVQTEVLQKVACRHGGSGGDTSQKVPPAELCWLEIVPTPMQTPTDLIKGLKAASGKIDAVYLSDLLPSDLHLDAAFDYAQQAKLPVVSQLYGAADKGALISLEADPGEQGELLGSIAARILAGDLPEDVPPAMPRRVSLTINLQTAKQLGIDIPFPVLLQTTRVIH